MSCVNYWTYCNKCKHETYSRHGESHCLKCNSEDVGHIREWDEEPDHGEQ